MVVSEENVAGKCMQCCISLAQSGTAGNYGQFAVICVRNTLEGHIFVVFEAFLYVFWSSRVFSASSEDKSAVLDVCECMFTPALETTRCYSQDPLRY